MLRRLVPFLILALGIGGFIALKATRPKPPPVAPQERIWRVETRAVSPGEHSPELSLFARVEAPDKVRAAAPVAGRLLEVKVRDGDRVAEGALLARLDPRDLEPPLAQARAELDKEALKLAHDKEALEQERALMELARKALERAERVQSQKLGSASDVDQAQEQLARAHLQVTLREQAIAEHPARLASLRARLAEAERDAARGEIRAPFEARIGTVESAAGDQVQPNQTILTLYPFDGLYLRAKIPGSRSAELKAALAKGVELSARAHHAGRTYEAILERIGGEADARGVDALLRLAPGTDIPLGAFADLVLERPPAPGTVPLPFAALNGGERVFTVEEGRLRSVSVERVGEIVESGTTQVLVRSPALKPGTRVMVTHLPNAVEGLRVEEVRALVRGEQGDAELAHRGSAGPADPAQIPLPTPVSAGTGQGQTR